MIVRDEEQHLPACLASLEGVVDEVVVVDTGSRDATVAIAERAGARVAAHPWTGDFAAARNTGLDLVRGRWVLYIDADERLAPVGRAAVETLLAPAREVAFRVLLRPGVGWTPYREYRLWRSDPRIRFEGMMHEKVVPAIHAVAAAEGRTIGACDLLLEHVGYEGDQTRKHRRNLPLLEAELARDPGSIFSWRHLARVRRALGDDAGADAALARAVALADAAPDGDQDAGLAYVDLARRWLERGDDPSALLDDVLVRHPANLLLVWVRARVRMDHGRHREALDDLARIAAADPARLADGGIAYEARLFGEWLHDSRGECLLRLGRPAEAAAAYAAAQRCAPAAPEYGVKRMLAEARARPRPSVA